MLHHQRNRRRSFSLHAQRISIKFFRGINGSSKFQVMLFQPNVTFIKATTNLCLCEQSKTEYGSCSIFQEYPLQVEQLRSTSTPVIQDLKTKLIYFTWFYLCISC